MPPRHLTPTPDVSDVSASQQRAFTSGAKEEPTAVSSEVLDEFDTLTKIIHELEAQHVETKVGRQGAHLKSIEQYIEAHKVLPRILPARLHTHYYE